MSDLVFDWSEPGIAVLRLNRPQRLNALTDDTVAELARTLDTLAADAALRVLIGLVSAVVSADQLLPRALELARSIAANSAFGVWMTKRGAWANMEAGSLQAALELENRTQILARTTGELARAAQALVERRKRGEG